MLNCGELFRALFCGRTSSIEIYREIQVRGKIGLIAGQSRCFATCKAKSLFFVIPFCPRALLHYFLASLNEFTPAATSEENCMCANRDYKRAKKEERCSNINENETIYNSFSGVSSKLVFVSPSKLFWSFIQSPRFAVNYFPSHQSLHVYCEGVDTPANVSRNLSQNFGCDAT